MIYCHIVFFWLLRFLFRPSLVCNMISCWVLSLFWCFIFVSLNKRAIETYYSLIRLSFLRGLRPNMVTYWHEISCISSYVFFVLRQVLLLRGRQTWPKKNIKWYIATSFFWLIPFFMPSFVWKMISCYHQQQQQQEQQQHQQEKIRHRSSERQLWLSKSAWRMPKPPSCIRRKQNLA